ncbi:RHS repeat domain-containing protein [candidate division CSSED10-310 bacterium]|uniref:RHS repeat domain-containing protein n=1 Tax=candidate division CSSED10-310 bacterium TaxID=2855610 RepID=A0ABV6YW53_UNCC1
MNQTTSADRLKPSKSLLQAGPQRFPDYDYRLWYYDEKLTKTAKRALLLALAEKMSRNGGSFRRKSVLGVLYMPITYNHDTRGRIESVSQGPNRTYILTYDSHGNLDTVTDPLGRIVAFDYDLAGRMTKQVMPDLREINVTFDASGNLKTIQPPGRPIHEFNYTPVNLEEDYIPPDIGIGPPQTHYVYNLDRQLTKIQRPDGKTVDMSYNPTTGFLETVTLPRGQYAFTYYPTTGYVQTMIAPGVEILTFTYEGALITGASFSGTVSGSISRTYNNNFQITSQSVNGGNTIAYQYDNDGLLNQAGDLIISRDPQNGLITGTTLGSITDNISYVDSLYGQNFGEVASYEAMYNITSLYSTAYERDHLGRITKKTEIIDGTPTVFEYPITPPAGFIPLLKTASSSLLILMMITATAFPTHQKQDRQ